jgi:Zn-finger nucleic acid-binding protein
VLGCAAMLATCDLCPICGSVEVKSTARKTITVCHCQKCKAVWHVLPDAEPTAA